MVSRGFSGFIEMKVTDGRLGRQFRAKYRLAQPNSGPMYHYMSLEGFQGIIESEDLCALSLISIPALRSISTQEPRLL